MAAMGGLEHPMREETLLGPPASIDGASDSSTPATSGDTVVIAIDGSKQAEQAFAWYAEHLHKKGNFLILVLGLEVAGMPTRDSWEQQLQVGSKKRSEMVEKYQEKFKTLSMSGKFVSEYEKPGELITDVAKRENATYVVMGTRGLGKIRRTILGSVSDFVVHHAHCPVIVSKA